MKTKKTFLQDVKSITHTDFFRMSFTFGRQKKIWTVRTIAVTGKPDKKGVRSLLITLAAPGKRSTKTRLRTLSQKDIPSDGVEPKFLGSHKISLNIVTGGRVVLHLPKKLHELSMNV